ncbi:MAG TPA: DUF5655 domain-containing protein [Ilumatobacter sp.]|nr:DUF5655 domain-containing protein [Ilumatobacter sp.]
MSGWTCPSSGRLFGRAGQSHDCAPGMGVDEYGIASVGIVLENPPTFAELRPLQNWVAISFSLARRARHRTITRKVVEYGHTFWHVANVATPHDLDPDLLDLLDLLTEAYRLAAR